MKEMTCGIVRDLLPSYDEGLLAEGTSQEVKAHLEQCGDCGRFYINLQSKQQQEVEQEEIRGKNFQQKLLEYRYYFLGFLVGLLLPIGFIALQVLKNMLPLFGWF